MKEIKVLEGKVVAPEGMKVGIVASRFNEIIVNKLLGGAVDGLVRHGVEEKISRRPGFRGRSRSRLRHLPWQSPASTMRSSASAL